MNASPPAPQRTTVRRNALFLVIVVLGAVAAWLFQPGFTLGKTRVTITNESDAALSNVSVRGVFFSVTTPSIAAGGEADWEVRPFKRSRIDVSFTSRGRAYDSTGGLFHDFWLQITVRSDMTVHIESLDGG